MNRDSEGANEGRSASNPSLVTVLDEHSSFKSMHVGFRDIEKIRTSPDVTLDDWDYPDGGLKAWLVVLGVTSGVCATFGFVNSWGVFQAAYESEFLRNESPSTIAWIGSVQYALVFMPGLIFGRLFDMGYLHIPVGCASIILILCTFLTAQCTEYWHFLLCQGFGIGLASGIVFTAGVGVIPHWFKKKLGLALGCMAIGSGVGGTIFPIILKNLIAHYSFQWTLRIIGFILLPFLILLNVSIARRLPPKDELGPFIDWSAFKNPAYTTYCASIFVSFLGAYTCLTYLSSSAATLGIDQDLSFYLLSIANGSSIIGRLGGGILADRFGSLNMLIPGTILTSVLTFAWPFATRAGPLIVVAVFYGIASGSFVALCSQPAVQMGSIGNVGRRTGMAFTIMSFGALAGPPISGAVLAHSIGGIDFRPVGYYAGSTVIAGAMLMIVARQLLKKVVGTVD